MQEPNVITVAEAATEKGCSRRTLYVALDRGDLNESRIGRARLIFKDEVYRAWQPLDRGRRVSAKTKVEE